MKLRKFNRYEKKEIRERKLRNDMAGTGLYVYENNTNSTLTLPKPTASGVRTVGPKGRFQGDSYFQSWVGHPMHMLLFIETIVEAPKPVPEEMGERLKKLHEDNQMKETQRQLFLDQPDTITHVGKVEHLVATDAPHQTFHETNPNQKVPDTLLLEDPLDGVEIILN